MEVNGTYPEPQYPNIEQQGPCGQVPQTVLLYLAPQVPSVVKTSAGAASGVLLVAEDEDVVDAVDVVDEPKQGPDWHPMPQ